MAYITEALTNYIFLLPFFLILESILYFFYKKQNITIKKGHLIGLQLLACLITAILSITGAAGIKDIGNYGNQLIRLDEINLIPFVHWELADLFGLIMNIILFIPFGIALTLLWKKGTSFAQTALIGFLFSLLIEISQLFNWRATDIDDLIMNTLGTIIGYGISVIVFKKLTLFQIENNRSNKMLQNIPLITMLLLFIFHFFIGKSFLSLIYRTIYGY